MVVTSDTSDELTVEGRLVLGGISLDLLPEFESLNKVYSKTQILRPRTSLWWKELSYLAELQLCD